MKSFDNILIILEWTVVDSFSDHSAQSTMIINNVTYFVYTCWIRWNSIRTKVVTKYPPPIHYRDSNLYVSVIRSPSTTDKIPVQSVMCFFVVCYIKTHNVIHNKRTRTMGTTFVPVLMVKPYGYLITFVVVVYLIIKTTRQLRFLMVHTLGTLLQERSNTRTVLRVLESPFTQWDLVSIVHFELVYGSMPTVLLPYTCQMILEKDD